MTEFFKDNNLNLPECELREIFKKMDLNGDGKISIKEFKYNFKNELRTKSLK